MAALTGLKVEILLNGTTWTDVTPYAIVQDGGYLALFRGQTSEGQSPDPGSLTFQFDNRDGRFSTNNPLSPYYGQIGRNTEIRVSVTKSDASTNYRWRGVVPSWPETRDKTGTDARVNVTAAGPLRQLQRGTGPLESTMFRGLTGDANTVPPVVYWPCEDGAQSSSLASAVQYAQPMSLIGSPNLASDSGFYCSKPLPVMNSGSIRGAVPYYDASGGKLQVRFLCYMPTPLPDKTQILKVGSTGSIPFWVVNYGSGGSLYMRGYDVDGLTVLVDSGAWAMPVDAARVRISMELTQSGSNVNWVINVGQARDGTALQASGTFTSQTVGRATSVQMVPGLTASDTVIGHVSVQNDITSAYDLNGQFTAFVGETVNNRLVRLSQEEGVNYTYFPPASDDTMGPQLPAPFMSLVQECVTADQGLMIERETALGLAYLSRKRLYNATPTATLDYASSHFSAPTLPDPDDLNTVNDMTASRPQGSSGRYVQPTGPLSVQAPPNGVGVYPDSESVNIQDDPGLVPWAAWRVHTGTVSEPRYTAVEVDLARQEISAALRDALLTILPGSRMDMTNLPEHPAGPVAQFVIGIREQLSKFRHIITFVCEPYSPYIVGVRDDSTKGQRDTAGSALHANVTSTAGAIQVDVTAGPLWTTDPASYPFDLMVGGERMTAVAAGADLDTVDGTFESGVTGWNTSNCTFTSSSAQAHSGTKSGLMTVTGSPTSANVRPDSAHQAPATPGTQYRYTAWVYAPVALSAVTVGIDWYTATNTYLSTSSPGTVAIPANTWGLLQVVATAPASAAFLRAGPTISGSPATGALMHVDDSYVVSTADYAASPQSFTVTRSVNGIVKAQTTGTAVNVADPCVRGV